MVCFGKLYAIFFPLCRKAVKEVANIMWQASLGCVIFKRKKKVIKKPYSMVAAPSI